MKKEDKYLGKTLLQKDYKKDTYEFLIQKYQTKLKGWKAKLLSHAGKTTLIESILASIPCYHMVINLILKYTCIQINNIQKDFWWGKQYSKGKLYMKAWKTFQETKRWSWYLGDGSYQQCIGCETRLEIC